VLDGANLSRRHDSAELCSFLEIPDRLWIGAIVIENSDLGTGNTVPDRFHTIVEEFAPIERKNTDCERFYRHF